MGSFESKPYMIPYDEIENDNVQAVQNLINKNVNINDLTVNFYGTEYSLLEFVIGEKYNNIFIFMLTNNYNINAALNTQETTLERIQTNMNFASIIIMQNLGFVFVNYEPNFINRMNVSRCSG